MRKNIYGYHGDGGTEKLRAKLRSMVNAGVLGVRNEKRGNQPVDIYSLLPFHTSTTSELSGFSENELDEGTEVGEVEEGMEVVDTKGSEDNEVSKGVETEYIDIPNLTTLHTSPTSTPIEASPQLPEKMFVMDAEGVEGVEGVDNENRQELALTFPSLTSVLNPEAGTLEVKSVESEQSTIDASTLSTLDTIDDVPDGDDGVTGDKNGGHILFFNTCSVLTPRCTVSV